MLLSTHPTTAKRSLHEVAYGYLAGTSAVAACMLLSALLSRYLQLGDLVMIQLLGVVVISLRFGVAPSLYTAVLSVLAFDYFFIPPLYSLALTEPQHYATITVMVSVAWVVSRLSQQLQRQTERARRKSEEAQRAQLQVETERLRSSLLSAISHDLKTPLTAILSAGQMLAKGDSIDARSRAKLASTVIEETERLEALVTNLLSMTRLESGQIELRKRGEAIDEVIGSALRRLEGRLEGRVVRTDVPGETPLVAVEPMLIEQVIINLLENALRYTPAGSPIEVRVATHGSEVTLAFSDRGPGIAPDELEKVFEKFYRGSHAARGDGGVGLGLTICRAIIGAHGGRMTASNRDGGGATFEFTLPADANTSGRTGGLPEPPASLKGLEEAHDG